MEDQPPRLSFDEAFALITMIMACRGTCNRLRTATTIRNEKNVLVGAGYNGALSGSSHCDNRSVGHLMKEGHCIRTNHGEENALFNCVDLKLIEGGTATILGTPCYPCARKLVGMGIQRITYIGSYDNSLGKEELTQLFSEKTVQVRQIEPKELLYMLQKALNFLQGPGGPLRDLPRIALESKNVLPYDEGQVV